MKIIFLCDAKSEFERVYSQKTLSDLNALLPCDVNIYSKTDILANKSKFSNAEYIFSTWGMPEFTKEEIIDCFPNLKTVFYSAGTVRYFAKPFLECGIKVFSAWAANAVPVAEYTVAQIILANKGFFASCGFKSRDEYIAARNVFFEFGGNFDTKVGIIGAGMIGSLVIERLKQYNISVSVYDPFLSAERAEKLGVETVSLEKLFGECSVVSNHLANNEETRGILTEDLFEKMLPNSTFINTGRGAQVVEDGLCNVLSRRSDIVALLDVTDPEPPLENSPLYTLKNCILTPHIAGSSGKEVRRMSEYMLAEFKKLLNGEKTSCEVTSEMLKTMA